VESDGVQNLFSFGLHGGERRCVTWPVAGMFSVTIVPVLRIHVPSPVAVEPMRQSA